MIKATNFVEEALNLGFNLWSGVPCYYLKPFTDYVLAEQQIRYVAAVNEGDAVAIASGNRLSGGRGVAFFQNSGLGNAVDPLTSMNCTFRIPILLIITLRGEPGSDDEPQHQFMGSITTDLLELMGIKWECFPDKVDEVLPALERAVKYMDNEKLPFAFIMKKNSVLSENTKSEAPIVTMPWVKARTSDIPIPQVKRTDMLRIVHTQYTPYDIVIGTTGYTGRELYALGHRENQFYMIGAMGCISSLSLGIAIARPNLRVIALDGDGAVLMRMGSLATVGYRKPANLLHIVLDNSVHESTGGQATVAPSIDLCAVAAACGYEHIHDITRTAELEEILSRPRNAGLTFVRARILQGYPENLPGPKEAPSELATQFTDFIKNC